MPTFPVRQSFNAVNQSVTLGLVPGVNSYVGIGIGGTWAGVLSFYGSLDGQNFFALTVQTYPWVDGASTGVQSLTQTTSALAAKNYVVPAGNLLAVKVVCTTYTSGTMAVALAASQDGSYQNAYQSQANLWLTATQTNAVNTVTVAANTNHGWKIGKLIVSFGSTPTTAQVQIADGASNLQIIDLPLTQQQNDLSTYLAGFASSPGNALVITVPASGGRTDINLFPEAA